MPTLIGAYAPQYAFLPQRIKPLLDSRLVDAKFISDLFSGNCRVLLKQIYKTDLFRSQLLTTLSDHPF
jgi:hypothetical protein